MKSRRNLIRQFLPIFLLLGFIVGVLCYVATRLSMIQALSGEPPVHWTRDFAMIICLVAGLVAAGAGLFFIYRISQALDEIRKGASLFAEGDLTIRLPLVQSAELAGLADNLNQMAVQLQERIATINQQRREQEAILGSMVEGVVAIDRNSTILQINQSASQFIGSQPQQIIGRSVTEVIRNHDLQMLVENTLATGRTAEGEFQLSGQEERNLQVHCTALFNADHAAAGALLVLHDITRIRRLERMRRDFVANVSHELKTPLTSIKGFAETLQDEALTQSEEARRFCAIIAKQVDRMQAIIEDLLSLSRIEQESEQGSVVLKQGSLAEVLKSGIQICTQRAAEKNIVVDVECHPEWTARINTPLFEQVVVNLVDNAIKYSDPGKKIDVKVIPGETTWEIRFIDQGCGIESVHLDRIFERFYRVDKARSRKVGGTGLGLAIVKHIVSCHGGRIRVESVPGQGSSFSVLLPR